MVFSNLFTFLSFDDGFNKKDADNLYDILEKKVIPMYYDNPEEWQKVVFKGMDDVIPEFTSARMAEDYYKKLY